MRTTKKAVTFAAPFTLKDVDERLPAGVYFVETDEELVEDIPFLAYRRLSTVMLYQESRVIVSLPGC